MLEEGIYKCRIIDAEIVKNDNGYSILKIYFDIVDGAYKGYFFDDYCSQRCERLVWHGTKGYPMPKYDSTPKDEVIKKLVISVKKIVKKTNPDREITARIDTWKGAIVFVKMEKAIINGEYKPWIVAKDIVEAC